MDLLSILIIAAALSMDAFSVSIAAGMLIGRPTLRHYFRLAFHFGLFQFFMPIMGYFGGLFAERLIHDYEHWVAMALLSAIGLKMIRDSFAPDNSMAYKQDPSRGWTLVLLSVATSLDALAVGAGIGLLGKPILFPSAVIGVVCALFSITGIMLGRKAGELMGRRVMRLGGFLLIAIGIKIVVEHMG